MTNARHNSLVILAGLSLALGGCQGIVWANLAAMFITVALFLGTVQLRRAQRPTLGVNNATSSVPTAQQPHT
jgi:thiosulfate reductase cytochrome b subunit